MIWIRKEGGYYTGRASAPTIGESGIEPGWEEVEEGSQKDLQALSDIMTSEERTPKWRGFREAVETSPEWLRISTVSMKAMLLAQQLTNLLWSDPIDSSGIANRWYLLFQEASPTQAEINFFRDKAIEFYLPEELTSILGG